MQVCNVRKNSQIPSKGMGETLMNTLVLSEQNPMFDVAIKDVFSSIGPRSVVDAYTTNLHNAAETLRRESAGLIQNCLLPSFYAMATGALLQKRIAGEKGLASLWASTETIDKFSDIFGNTKGDIKAFVKNILENLEGLSGNALNEKDWKTLVPKGKLENFTNSIAKIITDKNISKSDKNKTLKEIFNQITDFSKAEKIIRFKGDKAIFGSDLQSILRDTCDLGKKFINKNLGEIGEYAAKLKKLSGAKSLLAMPLILVVSASLQPINRWITRITSGKEGAPIYKDFGEENGLKPAKQKNLLLNKILATGLMAFTAFASTGFKIPTKEMFHFKGWTPTLDQCRWIAFCTFGSRFWAAEDGNELRESIGRDILTFSSLYFLGDYIAKGVAMLTGKGENMFNILKTTSEDASFFKKAANWIKNYKLKSFAETATPATKRARTYGQIANLVVSTGLLGIIVPLLLRKKTEQNHEEELKALKVRTKIKPKYSEKIKKTFKEFLHGN